MQKNKILLWDEIDHGKGFPWPTSKVLPKKYITRPPTLASLPVWEFLYSHRRKHLRLKKKSFVEVLSDFSKIQ
jgi:hypothetical protein